MAAAGAAAVLARRRERPVEELFNATEKTYEPVPKTIKRLIRQYMSQKVRAKAESGICNVCSAPCSSCMHLSIAQMGSKSVEFSDETDHVAVANQYSINEDKTGDSLYHSPSEASDLLNVNSSHDSYSENLESKAAARPSSKVVESHVDSILCAGRASDANIAFSYCSKDLDCKNSYHSSATVCCLGCGKVPSSQKLDLSELPSMKEVDSGSSSPRIQIPYSHSGSIKSSVGGGRPEISPKIHPKLEADIDDNSEDPLDKTGRSLKENELDESVMLSDKRESPLKAASLDEGYESDVSEHDVKVCDICGDAGREDLLAICSKCTDGAEHTYCMREMLRKVPEGDWLCEECKLAEETESPRQGLNAEGKKAKKLGSSTRILGKRHVEKLEGALAPKRQAVETNMGSPKSLGPNRVSSLSREGSFKNLDKGKVRPSPQISVGNHSGNDVPEAVSSPTSTPQLRTPKKSLMKWNSFNTLNSKPKGKLVDEVVLQKCKSAREHASLDSKEEPARQMGKSTSFKSGNSGRLNAGESNFKLLSSKYPHVQDLKGLKQVKERMSLERKKISKLDQSSPTIVTPKVDQKQTPRADVTSHSSAINHRETKAVQSDGRPNTLSRSTSSLARKGVGNAVSSAVSSTNGRISSEQKLNHVSLKEETSSSSSQVFERQPSNVNGIVSDGLTQTIDSTNQSEKSRESAVSQSSKRVPCLKCKEMGDAAECCSICLASGADQSASRTSIEETNKGNKLKAAIEAAMRLKPVICERTSQDLSSVCSKAKISVEDTYEPQAHLCNQASTGNMKLLNSHSTDAVYVVSSVGNLSIRDFRAPPLATISAVSMMSAIPEHEYIWQGGFDVNKHGKPPEFSDGIQAHISTLASPKVLDVVKTFPRKVSLTEVPRLSTWPAQFHNGSPKEDNIALYFFAKDLESYEKNYKMLLDNMVKNDLALKGNFGGVELLIFPSNQLPEHCQRWNNLLFLWGVFKGRKANRSNSSKSVCNSDASTVALERQIYTDSPQPVVNGSATCDSSCNVTTAVEKTCICTDSVSDNKASSFEQTYGGIKAKLKDQESKVDPKFLSRIATSSTEVNPKMKCTSTLEESKFPDCGSDPDLTPCLQATETNTGSFEVEEGEMHMAEGYPSLKDRPPGKPKVVVEEKVDGNCVKVEDSKDNGCADLKTSLNTDFDCWQYYPSLKDRSTGKQVAVVEEKLDRDSVKISDSKDGCADGKTSSTIDRGSWQLNHRKRPYIDLTEPVSEVSTVTCQKMPWSEATRIPVDRGNDNKKLKMGFSKIYQYSSARDQVPFSDSLASNRQNPGSLSSLEERRCDFACQEKLIPEDLGNSESFFLPMDSRLAGEHRVHDVSPNLELALGAETSPPNKGILPFFVGAIDESDNQNKLHNKVTSKQEEEDVSAPLSLSLSLSLSFPFQEKERDAKPVPKPEQQLPERHPVNTSLLLFRGFPEK
ncbi:RING/FYVE/PHD zinc finger superfamily protein, putative isoform 2 [Hibiscus syriacus]|uniref:RING/FYVE/PHD zinc finger superfamily protein, putative isoform 2 n=2 Tax=Hibiscus syriacus TaxID=106335 RepID=A0A6A2X5E2_HIBSY|nr:RING/FYVE/PHD zinc finger superfamily protein, putative isoform 2 [Hibiscus syriacus]